MNKHKAFIAGMKFGAFFCDLLPYAFFAGVYYGFALYVQKVLDNVKEVERQQEWKSRAEAGTWRPEK